MKRAPIVLASTAAGLGLVLSFHTHAPKVARLATGTGGTGVAGSSASGASTTTGPTTPTPASTTPATRRATSEDVQYRYGDIQLQVTETGSHITNIGILQEGATDPRSEEINSQAVPVLQRQALSAQSANIDGVSGATFTSSAYTQALQSALDQLAR